MERPWHALLFVVKFTNYSIMRGEMRYPARLDGERLVLTKNSGMCDYEHQ